jgi:hypothetical protein
MIKDWFSNQKRFFIRATSLRLSTLLDAVGAVMFRIENAKKLPLVLQEMNDLFYDVNLTFLSKWQSPSTRPRRKYLHILMKQMIELSNYVYERQLIDENKEKFENPTLSYHNIERKLNNFRKIYNALLSTGKLEPSKKTQENDNIYIYPPNHANVKIS